MEWKFENVRPLRWSDKLARLAGLSDRKSRRRGKLKVFYTNTILLFSRLVLEKSNAF